MSGINMETLFGREEETTSQPSSPVPISLDSPRSVLVQPVEGTVPSRGESGDALVSVPNVISSTAITNTFSTVTPSFTFPYPSGEGPSRLPRPLPQHLQVPRYLSYSRRPSQRPRPSESEPPTMAHRMMRTEKRITNLRDRTNILRTKVEDQDSSIVGLESDMEDAQLRIDGLEHTVLDLQETIHRFEMMFDAISKATAKTPSSPSP